MGEKGGRGERFPRGLMKVKGTRNPTADAAPEASKGGWEGRELLEVKGGVKSHLTTSMTWAGFFTSLGLIHLFIQASFLHTYYVPGCSRP